jgi:hypothetical protein
MRRIQCAASCLRHRRGAAPVATAVLIAGTIAGAVGGTGRAADAVAVQAAAAPACPGWTVARPPDPGAQDNLLQSVAVLSASNVWAVGNYTNSITDAPFRTLIEHWNGKAWQQVPSPNPGSSADFLTGIAAVSATNIWAVGEYDTRPGFIEGNKTLILHWNGHSWSQVPSPSPGSSFDALNTVRPVSATSIWAVGTFAGSSNQDRSLILHWNGHSWSQVASPNPGQQSDSLTGLAVVSASSAWTTEEYSASSGTPVAGLILHWNGHAWGKAAAVPAGGVLQDVSASSATNAWAVGGDAKGLSLALHWNGHAWSMMTSPSTNSGNSALFGVQATPSVSPWAVGESGLSNQVQRALVFRCR